MTTAYAQREHHEFLSAAEEALHNANLQLALAALGDTLGQRNKDAFSALDCSDDLRERARAIKNATMAALDEHLATLADAVERRGGQVHFAADAEDACRIVTQIARDEKARRVVKSKSMTTEEIHLNPALEKAGVEVVETDQIGRAHV